MKTARIWAVNYCAGCDRFIPAVVNGYVNEDEDKPKMSHGAYGKCLRLYDSVTEMESWKNIPERATVGRCYYFMNDCDKD